MPILCVSIVLWSVASLFSAFAGSYGTLLLTRLLLGAVAATAGPAIASLTGDYFPARERGQIYAYIIIPEVDGASCDTTTRTLTLGNPIPDPNHPGEASKGTLIIDFIDPKKRVLLWRGWAKTNVDLKVSGEKLQALAKSAVDQILAKFPSRR